MTIDHTMTLVVPEWAMGPVLEAIRELRAIHQSAGGTSKLHRDGDVLTFSFAGSVDLVLDLAAMIQEMRLRLAHVAALRAFAERLGALVRAER